MRRYRPRAGPPRSRGPEDVHHPMAHLVAVHAVNNHRPVPVQPTAQSATCSGFSHGTRDEPGLGCKGGAPSHVENGDVRVPSDQGVQGSASQGLSMATSVPSRPMMQLLQTSMNYDTPYHEMLRRLPQQPWLLLIHQLPPQPAYFRVKIWRRLRPWARSQSRAPSTRCPR